MGEIADALRRGDPLDHAQTNQRHGQESKGDRGPLSRPPTSDRVPDSQPRLETERRPIERPVLRLTEDGNDGWRPARICLDDPQGPFAQQYRRLAIRLRDLAQTLLARSIVVTSPQAGDGKTTTACNLAIALATTDHANRVVLIDLDLHRASIASALGIQVESSIDGVLRNEVTLEQATMETDVDGLCIVAAGRPAKDPGELLAYHALAVMIAKLESSFDWVIIDTPPILATSDAQVILQHAATALLVVHAGVSPVWALHRAFENLPKNKVLASFLNSSRTRGKEYGYSDDFYRDSDDLEETAELDVERS